MSVLSAHGWPGYYVNREGEVYSDRMPGPANRARDTIKRIVPWPKSCGHLSVSLRKDGKTYKRYVHVLVLESFVGPCPDGMECRHKDGNPKNNRLDNLEWATRQVNTIDRSYHKDPTGPRKLKPSDVDDILKLITEGNTPVKEIAAMYGVSRQTIGHIKRGKTWHHLEGRKG